MFMNMMFVLGREYLIDSKKYRPIYYVCLEHVQIMIL